LALRSISLIAVADEPSGRLNSTASSALPPVGSETESSRTGLPTLAFGSMRQTADGPYVALRCVSTNARPLSSPAAPLARSVTAGPELMILTRYLFTVPARAQSQLV
jgi:hypothetical protein